MKFGAAGAFAGEFMKLGEAGNEIAFVSAAETDEPGGSAEEVGVELAGARNGSDAFLEHGVAAADHVGLIIVAGRQSQPGGRVAGVQSDGFFEEGDGVLVVLEVVGRILAAKVEIVSLLAFGFGGGKFGGANAERREELSFQRGGDVFVEFENIGSRDVE